jgi:hypothetical protein
MWFTFWSNFVMFKINFLKQIGILKRKNWGKKLNISILYYRIVVYIYLLLTELNKK